MVPVVVVVVEVGEATEPSVCEVMMKTSTGQNEWKANKTRKGG